MLIIKLDFLAVLTLVTFLFSFFMEYFFLKALLKQEVNYSGFTYCRYFFSCFC